MELKGYQKNVLDDLHDYVSRLGASVGPAAAWNGYWSDRDFIVGVADGKSVPHYHDRGVGAAEVCVKVPTGGGKTFIGACALKEIFDVLRPVGPRFVVWLVPSEAILSQTIANFSNPEHPYRKRLNSDFGGKVEIFTKDSLLNGQNFSPDTVEKSVSIAIFCYDSIRSANKDGRKVYQENGNLLRFVQHYAKPELQLADTPETALVQVIRQLAPIVVVDESHNVRTGLSVDMLKVFGPSFVLSMTATPDLEKGNVISHVGAQALKAEHMVKLPVMVYNKARPEVVMQNAIDLRAVLEGAAEREAQKTGKKIRPIVLFQAQPKQANAEQTYEKIKAKLVEAGIPAEQVAIKTADKDELKGVDLMSETCPVRFVITVNALKEGWDCPFAYILASLANRSSVVDVEQVVGRILRQPFTREYSEKLLNMSYVLTSSDDFNATVSNIVRGLQDAGFGEQDCRQTNEPQPTATATGVGPMTGASSVAGDDGDDLTLTGAVVAPSAGNAVSVPSGDVGSMIQQAQNANATYAQQMASASVAATTPCGRVISGYGMQDGFAAAAKALRIPQFVVAANGSLGIGVQTEWEKLGKEELLGHFTLADKDAAVAFSQAVLDARQVDVNQQGGVSTSSIPDSVLRYVEQRMSAVDMEGKISLIEQVAHAQINRWNSLTSSEIRAYLKRVMNQLDPVQRDLAVNHVHAFIGEVVKKIRGLEIRHAEDELVKRLADTQSGIACKPLYAFPGKIYPSKIEGGIGKSLFKVEDGDMNGDETDLANLFAGGEGVEWWHRVRERGEDEFVLNGWINHYPDFVVKMKSGKLLLVESKGDDRDNSDSAAKLRLGRLWAKYAGADYDYYMIFKNNRPTGEDWKGALNRVELSNLLNGE